MKILITGFEPYHKVKLNSSMAVLEQLPRLLSANDFQTEILKSEFDASVTRIAELLRQIKPEIAISLGTSPLANVICLERFAVNLADAQYPDNVGKKPQEQKLILDAPVAYQVSIQLLPLQDFIRSKGIPAVVSNSAGCFVCNAVMFSALHTIATENLRILYLFVHLPAIPQEVANRPEDAHNKNGPSMSSDLMTQAIAHIIQWCKSAKMPEHNLGI